MWTGGASHGSRRPEWANPFSVLWCLPKWASQTTTSQVFPAKPTFACHSIIPGKTSQGQTYYIWCSLDKREFKGWDFRLLYLKQFLKLHHWVLELSTNLVRIQTKRCEKNSWGTLKQTLGNHPVYTSGPGRLGQAALSWELSYVLSPTELDLWEVRSPPQEREQDESQGSSAFYLAFLLLKWK